MTPPTSIQPEPDPTPPPSGPNNPGPTAELTALGARLRRLADRVEDLDIQIAELADAVTEQVLPRLAEHTLQIQELRDTVPAEGGPPVDWAVMDAERAATEWDTLASWIEHTLVQWFEITREQLPDCWALHRPAVIELAWLHRAHQAAYHPGAAAHLPAEWHTRWRPAALRAVRDVIPKRGPRTCGPGQHLRGGTERDPRHPPSAHQIRLPAEPISVPNDQLAERRHWQPFYEQAVTADLAGRRQRDGR